MSLYDFFFSKGSPAGRPSSASDPDRIREYAAGGPGPQNQQLLKKVARLEHDVGALALVVASILKRLDEKGQVTRDEVQETIRKLDLLDKVRDGRINVDDLGAGDFFDSQ
jgi:hypothetical protein